MRNKIKYVYYFINVYYLNEKEKRKKRERKFSLYFEICIKKKKALLWASYLNRNEIIIIIILYIKVFHDSFEWRAYDYYWLLIVSVFISLIFDMHMFYNTKSEIYFKKKIKFIHIFPSLSLSLFLSLSLEMKN